jgi:hypothetical protein
MAETKKAPSKGLAATFKGIPTPVLIGVPVVAGLAFWFFSRQRKASATTSAVVSSAPATLDTEVASTGTQYASSGSNAYNPAAGSGAQGNGSNSYSDNSGFSAAVDNMQGAPSTPMAPQDTPTISSKENEPELEALDAGDTYKPSAPPVLPEPGRAPVKTPPKVAPAPIPKAAIPRTAPGNTKKPIPTPVTPKVAPKPYPANPPKIVAPKVNPNTKAMPKSSPAKPKVTGTTPKARILKT